MPKFMPKITAKRSFDATPDGTSGNQCACDWLIVAILPLLAGLGCSIRPQFRDEQGTILYQRSRAVLHDPFPDNSIGPPVLGGRALGFEQPLSEPRRLQETSPNPRGRF
jgi:hypothetical protein